MYTNLTGDSNTAVGASALAFNQDGSDNTAVGVSSLGSVHGNGNIALGAFAGRRCHGDYNISIGNEGKKQDAGAIRIGTAGTQRNAYVAGISGVAIANGVGVIIDPDGHLGTLVSSEHWKDAIRPMDKSSEAILSLKPVTFRYKPQLDPKRIPQFGLVAEGVEKVDPDLVARDGDGKPYTVRYEAVNAMLLNEFLKEHRKVEEQAAINQRQEATIARQQAAIAQQQKAIEALTTALKAQAVQIQKVSDQLVGQAPVPRVVAND